MLVANFAWGFMSPLSKAVLLNSDVSPLALTTFRITGGAITFWIASLFVKRESVERRDMLMLALASIFAIVFNQVSNGGRVVVRRTRGAFRTCRVLWRFRAFGAVAMVQ